MSKIKTNKYFQDFLAYYEKAKKVQNDCNLGGRPYIGSCGDDLIEQVTIYDTIERQHAGFQNMLQDLWYGDKAPKFYKWDKERQDACISYNGLHKRYDKYDWLYIFLVHRITGSGASFEEDHGYRNTILPLLVTPNISGLGHMQTFIRGYEGVMYTSIGNQIPAFPKPTMGYKTGGKVFFGQFSVQLVRDTWDYIDEINKTGRKAKIREIVDYMCEWNRERSMKRFHFQYTAVAADLADYYPQNVDPESHMYYGKNAKEAMDLFAEKIGRVSKLSLIHI